MKIKDREIGTGFPAYIIAEMSANHAGSLERAKEIIHAAKESGADCIKLQTYICIIYIRKLIRLGSGSRN